MSRKRSGFTLIELLVVVAVIVLVLAMLAPTAGRMVFPARRNICMQNLHQMGIATAAYSADNRAYVPRDASGEFAHYQFAACLSPYINGKTCTTAQKQNWGFVYNFLKGESVWLCPEVTQTRPDGKTYVLNYVINGCDFWKYHRTGGYPSPAAPPCKITELPAAPSQIMYIMEFSPKYQSTSDFTFYDVWQPTTMMFDKLVPRTNPRMIHAEDMRHEGTTTIVHFDGSARPYKQDPYEIPVSLWNPTEDRYDPPE